MRWGRRFRWRLRRLREAFAVPFTEDSEVLCVYVVVSAALLADADPAVAKLVGDAAYTSAVAAAEERIAEVS